MTLYVYAVTLFVSAFILFLVQPLIGKMILPKLGGTPQVWNTCCVFFQMMLLAGYAYTHLISSRLKLRQQLILHSVLLLLPLGVLFLLPTNFFNLYLRVEDGGWNPGHPGENPIPATLYVLFVVIGLPFLVVSTTAPLLQKWFAYTGHPAAKDPYFLYGASNLGSLLALMAYPVVIEPLMVLNHQTWLWAIGYFLLIGTVLACVGFVWGRSARVELAGLDHLDTHPPAPPPEPEVAPGAQSSAQVVAGPVQTAKPTGIKPLGKKGPRAPVSRSEAAAETAPVHRMAEAITVRRRLWWVALAAVPSSLMLGITTHITTDLSPIPLFWVIPLALYLLTFVLVFARWPFVWTEKAHPFVVYLQPVAICALLLVDMVRTQSIGIPATIGFNMLGFFATTLLCHGELAKDRPSTRHLTEFYLWMSVGGMLGGMFNALVAPVVFTSLAELGIAIFAAGFLRPKLKESGWTDDLVSGLLEPAPEAPAHGPRGAKQSRPQPTIAKSGTSPQMALNFDFILPICVGLLTLMLAFVVDGLVEKIAISTSGGEVGLSVLTFGIPLAIACFYFTRPLRFGLALGAVIFVHFLYEGRRESAAFHTRSFFGIITVNMTNASSAERQYGVASSFRSLTHGSTHHGMNFLPPEKEEDVGNHTKDFSRLATTYYHRFGPAGRVMELYNWFPDPRQNVYPADARMPAAIVGNLMGDLAAGAAVPASSFTNLWSEPPFATIGLGTGTMASYGRPYQHVHYYEIDNAIRLLSLPRKPYYTWDEPLGGKQPYFSYLDGASRRGCDVQVLMGDARLRMALPYGNFSLYMQDPKEYAARRAAELGTDPTKATNYPDPPGGPERFYHMIVVDAFSSDAIPAHLLTKEAVQMYFKHLTAEGILCVHTSNRYVALPKVVAAVTQALNNELTPEEVKQGYIYTCQRGHDQNPDDALGSTYGHFTSEWVMVARKAKYLTRIREPDDYKEKLAEAVRKAPRKYDGGENYWQSLNPNSEFLWTDNYYTLWTVLRAR